MYAAVAPARASLSPPNPMTRLTQTPSTRMWHMCGCGRPWSCARGLCSGCCVHHVPPQAPHLRPAQYQDVVDERALAGSCGYPLCDNVRPRLPCTTESLPFLPWVLLAVLHKSDLQLSSHRWSFELHQERLTQFAFLVFALVGRAGRVGVLVIGW